MDHVPNTDSEESTDRMRSWQPFVRAVLLIYLVTLPACTKDAGHFGPGFFPLLAALLLVPVFAVIASIDAGLAWSEISSGKVKVAIAVGMSVVALGYWAIIVLAIFERGST